MEDKPNNTVIEMTSINKLEDALLRTRQIEPEIHQVDKTPSWDGEVRLYKSRDNFNKNNLYGRIPIQVKGTWVKKFQKNRAKFQADVSDLRNYMHDGGAIFFDIQIKDFDDYKIYYTLLLPFDLRKILEKVGNQQTKQIKLEVFPHKYLDGILRTFIDFIDNKRKQAKLLPNLCSVDDLKNIEVDQLEFSVPSIGVKSKDEAFEVLLQKPIYIYAKPKGIEASFAVDKIRPTKVVMHQDAIIRVKGEVLFSSINIIKEHGGAKQFGIGPGVIMTLNEDKIHIDFSNKGTLREQIASLKFLSALTQKEKIEVGNNIIDCSSFNFDCCTSEEIRERLLGLQCIDEMLKKLHVKKDLDIDRLTEKEINFINFLIGGIIEGRPVPFVIKDNVGCSKITFGNITVALSFKKNQNGTGFFISNFFKKNTLVLADDEKPQEDWKTVSPYIMMTVDLFKIIDNADISEIVCSVKEHSYTEEYGEQVILLVLELLKLYDSQEKKDSIILDTVLQLLEFLKVNSKENINDELIEINRLQTEKRRRKLTKQENLYLMSMKAKGIPILYQLAANILLGSFQEAQLIYDQLDETERSGFDTFPIKNLWIQE